MVNESIERLPKKLRELIINQHSAEVFDWPPPIARKPYKRLDDARFAVRLEKHTVVYRYRNGQWVGDKTY